MAFLIATTEYICVHTRLNYWVLCLKKECWLWRNTEQVGNWHVTAKELLCRCLVKRLGPDIAFKNLGCPSLHPTLKDSSAQFFILSSDFFYRSTIVALFIYTSHFFSLLTKATIYVFFSTIARCRSLKESGQKGSREVFFVHFIATRKKC